MSEEPVQNEQNKNRKRKRTKNFLKNAKVYAKKGQLGRGTKMSEELYQYFVGILDVMKQGIEDSDQKQSLVDNVLDRTKGDELNIIGNQLGCRVVELLLPHSSPEDLERYFEVINPELRKLCSDNFTSHVVETLLRVANERATEHLQGQEENDESSDEAPKKKPKLESKTKSKYSEQHVKNCSEFALKICKYALNNLEDFVWDSYANHILRSALKCLSGITLLPNEKPKVNMFLIDEKEKQTPPSPFIKKMVFRTVPDEYKELVKEFVKRLTVWPQFKDLPYQSAVTSGLLQVLLYAIKNVDKGMTRELLKQLLNESFAPDDWVATGNNDKKEDKVNLEDGDKEVTASPSCTLPPVFESEPAVRLLEAALIVAKKKMYTQIYARCFINRLAQLAAMPMLNFTVQRLFDNCQIKEELEPMFDELANKLGDLLACGNTGVIVSIAKACLRVKARQTQFVVALESALKVTPEVQKYFPVLCLRLLPADRVDLTKLDKEYFINVHGSVILQSILDYQRPAKAVNGLLDLSAEELVVIFSDAKGSHVADAFCKGQFVGVKARDKIIWKLKGFYQKLALSQHGSRALERIFEAASIEQKVKIMTEVADKSNLLNSTKFGRLVAAKLDVATFKAAQKQWEQRWKVNK